MIQPEKFRLLGNNRGIAIWNEQTMKNHRQVQRTKVEHALL